MKEFEKVYLLGVMKDNTILTCDIEKRYQLNNCNQVAIHFNLGRLFNINNTDDFLRSYFEEYFDNADDRTKICLLENGDITREEYINNEVANSDYQDVCDCSCTNYEIVVNNNTYNFTTDCGGQYDVRENDNFKNFIFTNKKAFDLVMMLWDNYHIKKLNDDENNMVNNTINDINTLLKNYDCSDFNNNGCYDFVVKNMNLKEE